MKNLLRIIKYVKNYKKGEHEGSYKSHKEVVDKHKLNLVIIRNNSQLKRFLEDIEKR